MCNYLYFFFKKINVIKIAVIITKPCRVKREEEGEFSRVVHFWGGTFLKVQSKILKFVKKSHSILKKMHRK